MWMHRTFTDTPVLWQPKDGAGSLLKKIQKAIEEKHNQQFNDYWELQQWSVENTVEFWAEVFDFFGIICSKNYDMVIDLSVPMSEFPEWFKGARVNYAENLLRYRDDHVALVLVGKSKILCRMGNLSQVELGEIVKAEGNFTTYPSIPRLLPSCTGSVRHVVCEDRDIEKVTYAQMYKEAELYAAAFREFGLKKNDVVVCYMSNRKEAMFAMLAVVSIGAIWTGALPLMGPQPVISRFEQVEPKVLITVDRFIQSGEEIDMLSKIQIIEQGLPSLHKIIIVPSKENSKSKDISGIHNSCFLDEFLELGRRKDGSVSPMEFEQVSFSHPIFISYTSGTSGKPKALMHGTGVLLNICQYYSMHFETTRESIYLSVSPVGWVTWIVNVTLTFLGYTLILYEGAPYFLTPTYIWDLVDQLKITTLFLPSSKLDELQKRGYVPQKNHSLSSLKSIMAGGSIVKPQNYDFVYEKLGRNIMLNTSYGCTEIMGVCLVTDSTLPVRRGEISCVELGILIECLDDSGKPVFGEIGELVLSKPIPSLALGIWGDTDGSLYREKYFSKYPGKFSLGDYGIINPITKGFIISGRSDETLKQRGCRFGSSEIYNIVEEFPEIRDSLCVSQYNKELDERAVLFLKIRGGHSFSIQLISRIREAIARELTIRHIPDVILETKDIPYNMNGKRMESVVKKIINKMSHSTDDVANKESLEFYYDVPELQAPF